MSSLPGYNLESYLLWDLRVIVDSQPEANFSLGLAEALGTVSPRPRLSEKAFAEIVALFEPHREQIEYILCDFEEECQSWRDYAGYAFDWIPEELTTQAQAIVDGAMVT